MKNEHSRLENSRIIKPTEAIEKEATQITRTLAIAVEAMDSPAADTDEAAALEKLLIDSFNALNSDDGSFQLVRLNILREMFNAETRTFFDFTTYLEQLAFKEAAHLLQNGVSKENIHAAYSKGALGSIGSIIIGIKEIRPESLAKYHAQSCLDRISGAALFSNPEKTIAQANEPGKKILRIDPENDDVYPKELLTTDPPLADDECWRRVSHNTMGVYNLHGELLRIADVGPLETYTPQLLEELTIVNELEQFIRDENLSREKFQSQFWKLLQNAVMIDDSFWRKFVNDERMQSPELSEAVDTIYELLQAPAESIERKEHRIFYNCIIPIRDVMHGHPLERTNLDERSSNSPLGFFRTGWPERFDDLLSEGNYRAVYDQIKAITHQLRRESSVYKQSYKEASKIIMELEAHVSQAENALRQLRENENLDSMRTTESGEPTQSATMHWFANYCFDRRGPFIDILNESIQQYFRNKETAMKHVKSIPLVEAVFDSKWNPQKQVNPDLEKLIVYMHRPDIRDIVEKMYDLNLERLSFGAQIQLGQIIMPAIPSQQTELQTCLRSFGKKSPYGILEALHAFSLSPEKGNRIIEILSRHDDPFISEALQHYGVVIRRITQLEGYIAGALPGVDIDDTKPIVQKLIARANTMLFSTADHIDQGETELLAQKMRQLSGEVIMMAALCEQTIKRNPTTEVTEIEKLDLIEIDASDFDNEDQPEKKKTDLERLQRMMIETVQVNFADQPQMVESFIQLLTHPDNAARRARTTFTVLRQETNEGNQLLSFIRTEEMDDDNVFVGSYNVNPHAQNAGIAESLGNIILKRLHPTKHIHATFLPSRRVGTMYIDRMGFVANEFTTDEQRTASTTGEFAMVLYKKPDLERLNAASRLRSMSHDDLRKQYTAVFTDKKPEDHIGEDIILAQFNVHTEIAQLREFAQTVFKGPDNYIMTRYLCLDTTSDSGCDNRLFGFEKVPKPGTDERQEQ